jgi:hypothetical protein
MTGVDLRHRLQRIYAAVGATVEGDLGKFPPAVTVTPTVVQVYQDFLGGLTDAQLENLAFSEIDNIAHLVDHLKKWCRANGHGGERVHDAVKASRALQLIIDLANRDKHGGGKSGRAATRASARSSSTSRAASPSPPRRAPAPCPGSSSRRRARSAAAADRPPSS